MSRPVLEVAAVAVRIDGSPILDRVSLEVHRAKIHAVVGPNGTGKSTLLRAVLGQLDFEGMIRLCLRGSGRIGYVPQHFPVDRTLPVTVADFLAAFRQRRPVCFGVARPVRTRIIALLDRVGLPAPIADRPLGALSGGELQRVLIGNAIDPEPELLLLDEPSSSLDAGAVDRLAALLVELQERAGTATLLVSHDAELVDRIADRTTKLEPRAGSIRREAPLERARLVAEDA